jgi:acetate kinase
MHVLVVNAGSSSLKLDLLALDGTRAGRVRGERLGTPEACWRMDGETFALPDGDHAAVLMAALPRLLERGTPVAVGHRSVHGGQDFSRPTRITDDVIATLEGMTSMAPLHIPANVAGIRAARALLPDLPHIAVFDTAFHHTLPRRSKTYAIDQSVAREHTLRRFGFHGTSHAFVAQRAADYLGEDLRGLRIITLHLGNGSSACAVEYGRSIETSMGATPLEGLVMGTRCGDFDAGAVLQLLRSGMSVDDVDHLLNRQSGLAGLSGVGNDMRDIEERAADGDDACRLAIHVFAHRIRKYIGAYAATMGGVDAVVFTAGIGENSALVRHHCCQRLEFLGARFDEDANRAAALTHEAPVAELSTRHSRVRLLAVATDEALQIARETAALAGEQDAVGNGTGIPIGISARHIHLTQDAVETLFGPGHTLTPRNPLSQPGQFACEEQLTIVGPKRQIEKVRVLGPVRPKCQVEISRTDEFFLGVDAPVRASGDVANTPGVTLVGPAGTLTLQEGLICAWRHIHMTTADAARFGVKNGDVVDVAVDSDQRDMVFGDVLVRVKDSYALEMHLDTDEANAAGITRGMEAAMIAPTGATAALLRRRTRWDHSKSGR